MEISGKIVQLLPLAEGQGKNGPWKKQEYIVETPGQYPKKVCIAVWGDKIDQFGLSEGEEVTFSVNVESREYNGRWYTDVKAWKVDKNGGGAVADAPPPSQGQSDLPPEFDILEDESGDDDLPF
ncbi:MAG TPA: hypothetical protein DDY13_14250 [Cytophagales bacterium]|jgi:hypothetical protein|nr:hypothetical protein [Cytophagales bacterium]